MGQPRQNRVTPLSELVATTARGLVYGNRGCLHDADGKIRRRWSTRRWISCQLVFKDWRRSSLLQPGKFTELFFLDEATAFAAGHRPCALCRRADYNRFVERWQELHPGEADADTIDARLHDERIEPGTRGQRHHTASFDDLPDGAFVLHGDAPHLVLGAALHVWSPGGYERREQRPSGTARVITPPSLVAVLPGWTSLVPVVHPSAL
jgi:hypothetical protein